VGTGAPGRPEEISADAGASDYGLKAFNLKADINRNEEALNAADISTTLSNGGKVNATWLVSGGAAIGVGVHPIGIARQACARRESVMKHDVPGATPSKRQVPVVAVTATTSCAA